VIAKTEGTKGLRDSESDGWESGLEGEKSSKRKRKSKNKSEVKSTESKLTSKSLSSSSSSEDQYTNSRTLYVEGLPFQACEDDIINFFKPAGSITSIRVARWHDTGRLRGYGHVEFVSDTIAEKALGLDGSYLFDRYIKVARPMTPKALSSYQESPKKIERPPKCKRIFVKNIPYDASEEDIRQVMMICGPIVDIRLAKWGHTQKSKGYCYVDFKREDSAEIAVKKNLKIEISGRPVSIDYDTGKPKGSFKK
jgi:nucleolin